MATYFKIRSPHKTKECDVHPGQDVHAGHSGHAGQPKDGPFVSPASAKNSVLSAWELSQPHFHAEIAKTDAEFADSVLYGKN